MSPIKQVRAIAAPFLVWSGLSTAFVIALKFAPDKFGISHVFDWGWAPLVWAIGVMSIVSVLLHVMGFFVDRAQGRYKDDLTVIYYYFVVNPGQLPKKEQVRQRRYSS